MAAGGSLRDPDEAYSRAAAFYSLPSVLGTLPLIYLKSESASDDLLYARLVKLPPFLPI